MEVKIYPPDISPLHPSTISPLVIRLQGGMSQLSKAALRVARLNRAAAAASYTPGLFAAHSGYGLAADKPFLTYRYK